MSQPASGEKQVYFYCYFFIFPDIASLALTTHRQIPKGPGFGLQRRYFCLFFAFNFRCFGPRRGQADKPIHCSWAVRDCSPPSVSSLGIESRPQSRPARAMRGRGGRLGHGWGWGVPLATATRGSWNSATAIGPQTSEGHTEGVSAAGSWIMRGQMKIVLCVT